MDRRKIAILVFCFALVARLPCLFTLFFCSFYRTILKIALIFFLANRQQKLIIIREREKIKKYDLDTNVVFVVAHFCVTLQFFCASSNLNLYIYIYIYIIKPQQQTHTRDMLYIY